VEIRDRLRTRLESWRDWTRRADRGATSLLGNPAPRTVDRAALLFEVLEDTSGLLVGTITPARRC
jgi:hypothetical protein